jgi:hypothetical protein
MARASLLCSKSSKSSMHSRLRISVTVSAGHGESQWALSESDLTDVIGAGLCAFRGTPTGATATEPESGPRRASRHEGGLGRGFIGRDLTGRAERALGDHHETARGAHRGVHPGQASRASAVRITAVEPHRPAALDGGPGQRDGVHRLSVLAGGTQSAGESIPMLECRRSGLYKHPFHSKIAVASSAQVLHVLVE